MAGDDATAIHGRFYSVATAYPAEPAITVAGPIISVFDFGAGEPLVVYSTDGRELGQATIVSAAYISPTVPSTTTDPVFGGDFTGYTYVKVCTRPRC